MVSAAWRATSIRLPPNVAQPSPSSVTRSPVRPICRRENSAMACPPLPDRRVVPYLALQYPGQDELVDESVNRIAPRGRDGSDAAWRYAFHGGFRPELPC